MLGGPPARGAAGRAPATLQEQPPRLLRSPAIVGEAEWGAKILEAFFVPMSDLEGAAADGSRVPEVHREILRSVLPPPPSGSPASRSPRRRRPWRSSSA